MRDTVCLHDATLYEARTAFLSEEHVKFHTVADFTAQKRRKLPAAVATHPTLFTGARAR